MWSTPSWPASRLTAHGSRRTGGTAIAEPRDLVTAILDGGHEDGVAAAMDRSRSCRDIGVGRPQPAVTRAMLRVLDHDDDIDPKPAAAALGIELTSLEQTLAHISNR